MLPSHWHRVSVQPTTDYHAKYLNITKGVLKGMRFTFAFLLTAILVFVFSFLIGLSISESIFGAAIGTAPILLAVLYYGFGWTAREEKHELRAIQTESQLHEMQEQLAELPPRRKHWFPARRFYFSGLSGKKIIRLMQLNKALLPVFTPLLSTPPKTAAIFQKTLVKDLTIISLFFEIRN